MSATAKRTYRLGARAEAADAKRERIVHAAYDVCVALPIK